MHTAMQSTGTEPVTKHSRHGAPSAAITPEHTLNHYQIIRRNGAVVPFEPAKIAVAMMKAFLAVHGTQGAASASVREVVETITNIITVYDDGSISIAPK